MKISIVGKGTSALITTLVCISEGHSVDIYYDPDSPILKVGESTTPQIAELIYKILGISITDMQQDRIVSLKSGVKFINWGVGDNFYHNFQDKFAFQFETSKFNPYISELLEKNYDVKFIPQKVEKYQDNGSSIEVCGEKYDFIIFCSGWDKNNISEYQSPMLKTVNSAVLYTDDSTDIDDDYTIHRATEDGWQFGLPFPKNNLTKCGYLFNNDLIEEKEVVKKIQEKNYKISNTINWEQKYAKKLIQSENCAYNGNRLFFLEPLQALSLYYYYEFAKLICQYLRNKNLNGYTLANYNYRYEMWAYQLSLCLHYRYGSVYDTIFWKKVVKDSKNFMNIPNGDIETHVEHMIFDLELKTSSYSNIGCFTASDIKQIHCGMSGKSLNQIINNLNS